VHELQSTAFGEHKSRQHQHSSCERDRKGAAIPSTHVRPLIFLPPPFRPDSAHPIRLGCKTAPPSFFFVFLFPFCFSSLFFLGQKAAAATHRRRQYLPSDWLPALAASISVIFLSLRSVPLLIGPFLLFQCYRPVRLDFHRNPLKCGHERDIFKI
jgi:hypothetical protein